MREGRAIAVRDLPAWRRHIQNNEPGFACQSLQALEKGDQIAKVALEVYGFSNTAVLEWIKKNNPQLYNVNRVEVGMQLTLPPLPSGVR